MRDDMQVPVLRNRKRAFVFGESPFDSFGPSFGKVKHTSHARESRSNFRENSAARGVRSAQVPLVPPTIWVGACTEVLSAHSLQRPNYVFLGQQRFFVFSMGSALLHQNVINFCRKKMDAVGKTAKATF